MKSRLTFQGVSSGRGGDHGGIAGGEDQQSNWEEGDVCEPDAGRAQEDDQEFSPGQ